MADGEAALFISSSESDGDSILSASVCYSADLTEDSEVISDASVTDSSCEERIGNANWYVT